MPAPTSVTELGGEAKKNNKKIKSPPKTSRGLYTLQLAPMIPMDTGRDCWGIRQKEKGKIDYAVINTPVQLNYRFKVNSGNKNKWLINVKAGPSCMLISGTTDYHTTVDVGGIYQVDPVNRDAFVYYNFFETGSAWNVHVTSAGINNQNTNPGAAAIFALLYNSSNGFDFASNKNYRDQKKLSRMKAAFNFSVDGHYRQSETSPVSLKIGVHAVYAPLLERKEKYKPLERTTGEFNSIFNSSAASRYFGYGINIGLVYDFNLPGLQMHHPGSGCMLIYRVPVPCQSAPPPH